MRSCRVFRVDVVCMSVSVCCWLKWRGEKKWEESCRQWNAKIERERGVQHEKSKKKKMEGARQKGR